jgi:hypothetical protein
MAATMSRHDHAGEQERTEHRADPDRPEQQPVATGRQPEVIAGEDDQQRTGRAGRQRGEQLPGAERPKEPVAREHRHPGRCVGEEPSPQGRGWCRRKVPATHNRR